MYKKIFITFLVLSLCSQGHAQYQWTKLDAPAYKGKQDDIYFVNEMKGWYVNGAGKIYKTSDGGENWKLSFEKTGTFFRCIAFIDSLTGFAGNIGTDYFPNVKDTVPLYKTTDGGTTWQPVAYTGPTVKGLCAIEIVKVPYVNHGVLAYRYKVIAGGRVGNPAYIMRSEDNGSTFKSMDMNMHCAYILDIKFYNEDEGFVMAGSSRSLEKSNALILKTKDGGKTWKKVYQSKRPYEITWKGSFPDNKTGYVTVQSYNPDSTLAARYIVKTKNGGKSWKELKLTDDFKCRPFGIGFINKTTGWVGTSIGGLETIDGGHTWKRTTLGNYVNKIRVIPGYQQKTMYSIGSNVYKLVIPDRDKSR